MKYRPGPWWIERDENEGERGAWLVKYKSLEHIEKYGSPYLWNFTICKISGFDPIDEATARLITAAPELLDSLKALLERVMQTDDPYAWNEIFVAERVIAKAEGK